MSARMDGKAYMMYVPVGMVVLSNVLYHLCSKQMNGQVHPLLSLAITYMVSCIVCFVAFLVHSNNPIQEEVSHVSFYSFILGIVLIGIEGGYLWMYRSGWPISQGSLVANLCVAILLFLIGLRLYHEGASVSTWIGLACCIIGLVLLKR